MERDICSTLKTRITNDQGSSTFNCPACGKFKIVRSAKSRSIAAKYTCPSCGFVGPN